MQRDDLIFKDECYKIVGILYEVYKELGGNLLEKHYQKAIAIAFNQAKIKFIEQFPVKIYFQGQFIGIFYTDYIVEIGEAKIVLEIKKDQSFAQKNIKQVNDYLKALDFKLGILANFTKSGVKFKRLVNL